ncbi:sugar O-acetyltransferase [Candidatus Colwellia aromaticivorans]|uniref:sugar O-acetyltransferase n=1 Tax=Candidatus Colwellia aromaticivorans TaxID=2267621 RepID=UPI000DF2E6E6|nr:sugar O-acetyltransferase [Candidatus Colwellia aromaticivorans]
MKKRFDSLTPELIAQRKSVHELCRQFSRSPSKGNLKRLKALFHSCGEEVFIEHGFHMDYGDNITIGDRVFINVNCTLIDGKGSDSNKADDKGLTNGKISIGNDCLIGPNVQLLAVSHDVEPQSRLEKHNYIDDIIIGNNVWLGGGVIILAGVIIGDNVVIGAGSVVTKNVDEQSFYAGNPAQKIRAL